MNAPDALENPAEYKLWLENRRADAAKLKAARISERAQVRAKYSYNVEREKVRAASIAAKLDAKRHRAEFERQQSLPLELKRLNKPKVMLEEADRKSERYRAREDRRTERLHAQWRWEVQRAAQVLAKWDATLDAHARDLATLAQGPDTHAARRVANHQAKMLLLSALVI